MITDGLNPFAVLSARRSRTHFLIGDENGPFHGKITFALPI